jgi:hypothetical protein
MLMVVWHGHQRGISAEVMSPKGRTHLRTLLGLDGTVQGYVRTGLRETGPISKQISDASVKPTSKKSGTD